MSEDFHILKRKAEYVERLRRLGRGERSVGFVACLVGVLGLLVVQRLHWAPPWTLWLALAVIAVGWGLLAWSLWKRLIFLRQHPFDEET